LNKYYEKLQRFFLRGGAGLNVSIPVLLFALFIFPSFIFADHARIAIYFKDGSAIKYTADSYWTKYNKHDGYYEYFEFYEIGATNPAYVCISDYVDMNPVSRETKKGDYRTLRDQAEALGRTCHYFDVQKICFDQYGVSFLNEEVERIEIIN